MSDQAFGVLELAESMRISRNTLHRRLKPLTGESPLDCLRNARLERARNLLRENEWTVSEIAYAVGFKSVSHFSYCFSQAYGITPSAFAESG